MTTERQQDDSGAFALGSEIAGRYIIEERIGEGGVGHVYRATHRFLRTTVAIKVLRPAQASSIADKKRFEREAFALSKVAHDNCLAVSDFGEHEGIVFLVTEYLEGSNLGDILFDVGPLSVIRSAGILAQLLRALGHAHERGVVHRDLKPDNIFLIEKDGNADFVKVLDFGLAKLKGETLKEEGGGDLTEMGVTFGTPKYMAPEQVTGRTVDGRTDLYAVSVIAYHMVAGRAPFVADDPHDLLMAHCSKMAPMFADIGVENVPSSFEEVIRRGLRKSPDDRYQNAREYLEAIDQCVRGGAVDANAAQALRREPRELERPAKTSATMPLPANPVPVARAALSGRRLWIAIAVVFAALGTVGLAAALRGGDDSERDATESAVETSPEGVPALDPAAVEFVIDEPELEKARQWAKQGDVDRAIDDLRPRVKGGIHRGRAAFLLGNMYFSKMYWTDGFEAYETAIERDPDYRSHPLVIANAIAALGSQSKPHLAQRFIRRHLGAAAIPKLNEASKQAKYKHHRDRAAKMARELSK